MSVELDPSELGFKRMRIPYIFQQRSPRVS